jgi:hypothetical protein
MKKLLLVGALVTLFASTYQIARSQWVQAGIPSVSVYTFTQSGVNLLAGTGTWGLYLSTDNGASWVVDDSSLLTEGYTVSAFATLGSNLYLGGGGDPAGVYRSTNSGITWTASRAGLTDSNVNALLTHGPILLAGTQDSGVYRSVDSGKSWSKANAGLPDTITFGTLAVSALTTSGGSSTSPFIIASTFRFGIFRSSNDGLGWISIDSSLPQTYFYQVASDNLNLYAATDNGVYISTNNGDSWVQRNIGLPSLEIRAFALTGSLITPTSLIFVGTRAAGVCISTNYGSSWTPINDGLGNTDIQSLFVTPSSTTAKPMLFAGTNDGIWMRPLSDFASVTKPIPTSSELTINPNHPNPVSTETTFTLSNSRHQFVDAKIMDILGKECANIFSGNLDAGDHSFEWNATHVPDGVYFCVVRRESGAVEMPLVVRR